jgi:chaperonin GroEL
MKKEMKFDEDAKKAILAGVEKLSRAVKVTLGPRGKNVAIDVGRSSPLITKDGVTVAQAVALDDPFEAMGAQMVREVASKTNTVAGDGTTTATVLAEAIYKEGLKNVSSGVNPMSIKRGIDIAVDAVVEELTNIAKPVVTKEEIAQVGTLSANGDKEIGQILAEAMERVGVDGAIAVDAGSGVETTLYSVEGMQFDRGYLSAHFITDKEKSEVVMNDPYILIYENKLNTIQDLLPLLQAVGKKQKPLLIIADDIDSEVLTTLVVNKLRGSLNACAIKSPSFGGDKKAMMEDMAVLTGGTVIGTGIGKKLENITIDDLGQAGKITITKDLTTIVGGKGDPAEVEVRATHLRNMLNSPEAGYDIEKLADRLAKLSGGVALISVGGITETAVREKHARVDDALHATRAAVAEGIVPGGGTALIRCIKVLDDISLDMESQIGVNIIKRAIQAPLAQLVNNAGFDEGSIIVNKVMMLEGNEGYNVATGEFVDMIEAGIIDPVKVTRSALQNAASISGLLLTTDCMIAVTEFDPPIAPPQQ